MDDRELIERALRSATHTKLLVVEPGVVHDAATLFVGEFADSPAIIIADDNTMAAAGRDVRRSFEDARRPVDTFVFGPHVYANEECVRELEAVLSQSRCIPVAVGSGTINDLTKLAAHRMGRSYVAVATAASMDGYTAYGASITAQGSKQTFDCPAPRAVLADVNVIQRAPVGMNAWGYADLVAKIAAGADWIVADALGVEPIQPAVWDTVQAQLHSWVGAPQAIATSEPRALTHLLHGLMMSGFAMQAALTSRPASGAEHQFSHLWDMQHHTHEGRPPSHGFKVGIGTLASIALFDELLARDLAGLDVQLLASEWPSLDDLDARIHELLGAGELAHKAHEEMRAKYVSRDALRDQLQRLTTVWPGLREKLHGQLIPLAKLQAMLPAAGCPTRPEQIGITRERLRQSYWQALFIRRRFTVLDLAHRTHLLEACLERLFSPTGAWGVQGAV